MLKTMKIAENRATPWKIAAYLVVVTMLGTFGIFLVGAVVTSRYFDALNKLSYREFFQWRTLASTAFVSILGMAGVAMSYTAHKLADELWDMVRNKKSVTL